MRLVDGHKGKAGYRCTVTGREAHSAYPELGANAVVAAARLIDRVAAMGESVRGRRAVLPTASTRRTTPPASAGSRAARSSTSSPTTAASSSSSAPCRARTRCGSCARCRRSPIEAILPTLRATAPEAAIAFEEVLAYPGLPPAADTRLRPPLPRAHRHACARPRSRSAPRAAAFAARGIPALVCGPGDINVAHKPDEWIALEQLERCDAFLRELVRAALG